MKITLVSQGYPPETAGGGICTQTYLKAKGLCESGHEVYVISRSIDEKRHENIERNLCVIRIPGFEAHLSEMTDIVQWLTHSALVAAEIDSLNKRVGLDIIDFPEWAAEAYTYLLNRTEWNGVPTVIQLHGPLVMLAHTIGWPDVDSDFYRIGTHMEATCVQLADAIYSSSECSTKWIQNYYEPKKECIPTLHLGVNTTEFASRGRTKYERPTIVFVGKIVQNKGVSELVDAAVKLTKDFPSLRLRLLGRGDDTFIKHLQAKADQFGAAGLLEFPGFIEKDALPDELSRSHIFAAPSHYEGGPGFVFLEAMACGLPVVGCSGSGVDEIVTSGKDGLLVPPRDSKALEEALRTILGDKKLMERMGTNARDFVLRNGDSRQCLAKLEAFYYSVLGQQPTQTGFAHYGY